MKLYSSIEIVHMEQDAIFEEKVSLSPKDMNTEILSFDDILIRKMRKQIEGKCTKHGFLIPNSLKMLSRSYGYMEKGTFTADSMYYIKAQGRVYNPPNGTVVEGVVMRKSKAGLYIIIEQAVHVMVVRDLHIGNKEFDAVELGDTIRVEIKKSRFQINDPHILSIGQFLTLVSSGVAETVAATAATAASEAAADEVADEAADEAVEAEEAEEAVEAEEAEEAVEEEAEAEAEAAEAKPAENDPFKQVATGNVDLSL
jgi:DNA-directed RNA polymerase subunit E'/Rpb7